MKIKRDSSEVCSHNSILTDVVCLWYKVNITLKTYRKNIFYDANLTGCQNFAFFLKKMFFLVDN